MASDLVVAVAAKALDGLFQRQTALADNIANAGSPSFRAQRVTFESELRHAIEGSRTVDLARTSVQQVQPRIQLEHPLSGTSNRLDLEVSSSNETSMRYNMLVTMLDRNLMMRSAAVTETRGR